MIPDLRLPLLLTSARGATNSLKGDSLLEGQVGAFGPEEEREARCRVHELCISIDI